MFITIDRYTISDYIDLNIKITFSLNFINCNNNLKIEIIVPSRLIQLFRGI